jgi:hypothetical protein
LFEVTSSLRAKLDGKYVSLVDKTDASEV